VKCTSFVSALCVVLTITLTSAYAQDNWNGGTGNWTNGSDWSAGLPAAGSDVVIYSGGSDTVTLDTSPTINSLTLGGASNGFPSELTGKGPLAQTLTITNGLTVGQTGFLDPGITVTAGTLTNNGTIGDRSTELGPSLIVDGAFVNNGTVNFSNVTAGSLVNGNTLDGVSITAGSLVNFGSILDADNRGSIQINGNANNSGTIEISFASSGGLAQFTNITGTLTNSGNFNLYSNGASMGSLVNSGSVGLDGKGPVFPATLQVNGDATNSGQISGFGSTIINITGTLTNSGTFEGNTVTIGGMLTNEATGQINLLVTGGVLQALGGLSNNGVINVNNGSSIDPPFVNNGGIINIDSASKMIVGTGTPSGLGYIQLANGTLGEIINSHNSFGVININGSALLDGTLNVLLQGGFNPRVGSIFQFLFANPGQIGGAFGNIQNDCFDNDTECWLVTYDRADGIVELTAEQAPVPEPATLLVLIPGLLVAGYGLRRRLLQ